MTMERLQDLLKAWAKSLKHNSNSKLGFPSRSLGMSTGGNSTSFDEMYESMQNDHIKTIQAIIFTSRTSTKCCLSQVHRIKG
jgi:hypothetical protein